LTRGSLSRMGRQSHRPNPNPATAAANPSSTEPRISPRAAVILPPQAGHHFHHEGGEGAQTAEKAGGQKQLKAPGTSAEAIGLAGPFKGENQTESEDSSHTHPSRCLSACEEPWVWRWPTSHSRNQAPGIAPRATSTPSLIASQIAIQPRRGWPAGAETST